MKSSDAALRRFAIDDAVLFALLMRVAQGLAGAVTLVLVAHWFSPAVQGFYYTFMSLLALQAFIELSFQIVVVSRASHEWSRLSLESGSGVVIGDADAVSRLASLARFIGRWYAVLAVLFLLGVGAAGDLFMRASAEAGIAWRPAWWASVALAALQVWLMAPLALLEGCNQVAAVNRLRFWQVIAEALVIWLLLAGGSELWVVAGALAVKVVAAVLFVGRYRAFFRSLLRAVGPEAITWRDEIWPMQWRVAAQASVNYLTFSLFTPIMFHYYGAEAAGRMGMTLQLVSMVMALGQAWLQTRVPQFGMLVAKREFEELDRVWGRACKAAFTVVAAGALAVWCGVALLPFVHPALAARLLAPLPTLLFLVGFGLMQLPYGQALYLRAHAREPYLFVGVSSGVLIGAAVFVFGRRYGELGAAASFAVVVALYLLPIASAIWVRRRAEWQGRG